MNTISRTALSNFKKNKSRNILIGVAVALTAFLLTAVPTIVMGYVNIQNQAVSTVYPTFHGMFRDVDFRTVQEIMDDEAVEQAGLREDAAVMFCEDSDVRITMLSIDKTAAELSRQELEEGVFPEKAAEIVVSKGILEAMGQEGSIGDTIEVTFQPAYGDGIRQSREFTIVGMTADTEVSEKEGIYFAFVSDAFAEQAADKDVRLYRMYFRINHADGMVTDDIKKQMEMLGERHGLRKKDILMNSEYLSANYIDTAMYQGLILILLVIAFAGVLTIYSIYYVSMLDKVQEYGKLRAIGATRRQIRQIVFREGLAVAAIATPTGILLGLAAGVLVIVMTTVSSAGRGDIVFDQMRQIIEHHEVRLVQPWIIIFCAVVSLATVYVSLLRPMQTAAKITAIEALRYQGNDKSKKKIRKGYQEVSTGKLTVTNLIRNKKRTAATIFTLGATGILFIVVATLCSCMDPEIMARQELRGDIQVSVDSWGDDEMYPEHSLQNIQKNNPLTEELRQEILRIEGVSDVDVDTSVTAGLEGIKEDDGRPLQTNIKGISSIALEELKAYVAEGTLDDPCLGDGSGIILGSKMKNHFEEMTDWEAGDKIYVQIMVGEQTLRREFRIAAIVDGPASIGGTYLSMPSDALQSLCEVNLMDCFEITAASGAEEKAAEEISRLIADREFLEMKTYDEVYKEEERGISLIMYGCYGMLLIFGLIGILNLVNTMINSVYVRRKEIGMLQAIGMSGHQTVNMLQMEGLFYTIGTLVMSLGLGSLLGYGAFLWAKEEGILAITAYQYPVFPAIVLAAAVLVVQLLVTYLVNYSLKKQSLIDRIRFAE